MFSLVSQIFTVVIVLLLQVIKATWWIVLPVVFLFKISKLVTRKRRSEYAAGLDWILLEATLPQEITKTPKAMENVLTGFHGVWTPQTKNQPIPDAFSLEMTGYEGEIHFYIRCQRSHRRLVESKVFSQYPNIEIQEAEDYTSGISDEMLKKEYELWGADYVLAKDSAYPLKTYDEFEDMEEERRMDPISQFAELAAQLEEGEHLWLQLIVSPVLAEAEGKAEKTRDELMGRKAPQQGLGIMSELQKAFSDLFGVLLTGEFGGPQGEAAQKPEQQEKRLTPREGDMVKKIEEKASKVRFNSMLRGIYVARNEMVHKEHIAGLHGFFRQFSGMNEIQPESESISDQRYWFFEEQRDYLMKKHLLQAYKNRVLKFVANPYILSTEEIATLYHFPGRVVQAPFMPRTPSKTSEPPRGLPT